MLAFSSSTCWSSRRDPAPSTATVPTPSKGRRCRRGGLFRLGRRCRARRAARCRGLICCRGLNGGALAGSAAGGVSEGDRTASTNGGAQSHSHRLGLIAIVLPRGGGDRAAQAQQGHDDPLSPFGCRPFARWHEVVDPDLIGPDRLDIPDIGGAKHRLDLRGGSAQRHLESRARSCTCGATAEACGPAAEASGRGMWLGRAPAAAPGRRAQPGSSRSQRRRADRPFRRLAELSGAWIALAGPLLQCHPHLTMRGCWLKNLCPWGQTASEV